MKFTLSVFNITKKHQNYRSFLVLVANFIFQFL